MAEHKPNILLIMADQMTPFLTGAYGHPVVKTPSLDRLVERGVRFDAAYSPCPVCAPARASLLTGKYTSNIGAWDNGAPYGSEEPTLPHYLTLAGYDSVLSGKMHFIGPDQHHGFTRRLTTEIYPAGFDWTPKRGQAVTSARSHAQHYVSDAIQVGRWSDYLSYDEEAHFRALEYLHARGAERISKGEENTTQPFFLCVSYHHPHEPFWPAKEFWNLYEGEEIAIPEFPDDLEDSYTIFDRWLNINHGVAKEPDLRKPESLRVLRRAYYALVSYVDRKIGELVAALEENGLSKDTVIIFTSDHGDMLVEKGMVQKRTFYEWSSRVPLILSFPNDKYAGMRRPEPVNLVDLLPTLLDIAGIDSSDRLPVDGRSLQPSIQSEPSEERFTFSEYHSQGTHAPCFMVRKGKYKYVYIHGYENQLFDLESDPGEWSNLVGNSNYSELIKELEGLILTHFDPDHIESRISESVRKRHLIRKAMQISRMSWDVEPRFNPQLPVLRRYLPNTNK
jgi:choline-sulfatase